MFCLYVWLCTTYQPGACGGQKRALNLPEVVLREMGSSVEKVMGFILTFSHTYVFLPYRPHLSLFCPSLLPSSRVPFCFRNTHVQVCVCVCVCVWSIYIYICMYACMYMCVCVCVEFLDTFYPVSLSDNVQIFAHSSLSSLPTSESSALLSPSVSHVSLDLFWNLALSTD